MMTVMTTVMTCSQWRGGWRRRRWLRQFARAGWTQDTQRGARRACKENIQDVANLPIELVYLEIRKSETFANHLLAATSPPPWWNPHPLWNEKIVINKIGKRWRFCWSKSSSSNCDQTISVTHGAPTWNNLNLSCHQPPPQHYWFKNQFCDKNTETDWSPEFGDSTLSQFIELNFLRKDVQRNIHRPAIWTIQNIWKDICGRYSPMDFNQFPCIAATTLHVLVMGVLESKH